MITGRARAPASAMPLGRAADDYGAARRAAEGHLRR